MLIPTPLRGQFTSDRLASGFLTNTAAMSSDTQLVISADGGIGAAYVNACLSADSHKPETMLLTSRREVSPLTRESDKSGKSDKSEPTLHWLQLDYEQSQFESDFVDALREKTSHIDTLVIASGILHRPGLSPEKNIGSLETENMRRLFDVNAAGPLALLAALEPLLKEAECPKIAVLSAQVGSIEDNGLGGWYSYRMSKAALNMGIKTAAIELARWKNSPTVISVHPGTTHSPLSQPFVKNRKAHVQSAATAGERLHRLVEQLDPEQTGTFVTLDGDILPW